MTQEQLNIIIGRNVRKYHLLYNANNNEKITQASLAKDIGVSTSLIGALESRRTN